MRVKLCGLLTVHLTDLRGRGGFERERARLMACFWKTPAPLRGDGTNTCGSSFLGSELAADRTFNEACGLGQWVGTDGPPFFIRGLNAGSSVCMHYSCTFEGDVLVQSGQ